MTSIRRRVLLMLAAALVCTWVTAFAVRPSREAIRAVAAYAPDIAQGIVYDDGWSRPMAVSTGMATRLSALT